VSLPRNIALFEQGQDTRTRILEAAVNCIVDLGYHRTTTTEIVKRTGVARGTFFHHFPTKQDMMLSVSQYIDDLTIDMTVDFALNLQNPKADEVISAVLDFIWKDDYLSRYGIAARELRMAARSDQELSRRLKMENERNRQKVNEKWSNYAASAVADIPLTMILDMIYIFIAGMVYFFQDNEKLEYQQQVMEQWKKMIMPLILLDYARK
jgi:AcrR family transcriptional regulator